MKKFLVLFTLFVSLISVNKGHAQLLDSTSYTTPQVQALWYVRQVPDTFGINKTFHSYWNKNDTLPNTSAAHQPIQSFQICKTTNGILGSTGDSLLWSNSYIKSASGIPIGIYSGSASLNFEGGGTTHTIVSYPASGLATYKDTIQVNQINGGGEFLLSGKIISDTTTVQTKVLEISIDGQTWFIKLSK